MARIIIESSERTMADAIETLVAAIKANTDAIKALQAGGGGQPVDLTPITKRLDALEARNTADDQAASALGQPSPPPPAGTISISPTSVTSAVGAALTHAFTASGGASPYTWSATGLPADLVMSGDGTLSGTPSAAETATATFTATDATGLTGSQSVSITIS